MQVASDLSTCFKTRFEVLISYIKSLPKFPLQINYVLSLFICKLLI